MESKHMLRRAPLGAMMSVAPLGAMMMAVTLGACSDASAKRDTDRFAVTVTPLSLSGVSDAFYTLRVWNGATPPALVWEQEHLRSQRYGDGKGSLAYVGTCDAGDGVADNTVELVLEKLVGPGGGDIDADTWQNPAPASDPLRIVKTCRPDADTAVAFNITVMRDAKQGFFDVAVTFDEVFCSAKFDCAEKDGGAIELLHRPGGERDRTLVMGFACTSGAGRQTWLHMSDVLVECGTAPDVTSYWIDPARVPEGNAGAVDPIFYQTGIYRGEEDFPELDKCYWNLAFGIDEGPSAANCRIIASGTASSAPFDATGATPDNTVWPYVSFSVPITDASGNVACGQNPLNGEGSAVTTQYTGIEGSRFPHAWQCGETPVTQRIECQGSIDAVGASFTQTPDGIAVAFGNSTRNPDSARYTLPAGLGLTLSDECCMNPCCADVDSSGR